MKLNSFLLSLSILAAAGQALPANAQEGGSGAGQAQEGGSRWVYKMNTWGAKPKQKLRPMAAPVPHSVSQGSMPSAASMLGITPADLKPAPAPTPKVQQQVQAIVSVPRVQAAPFNNQFGAPVSEHIAHSKPMTESPSPAAKSMPGSHIASSGDVHGTLRPYRHSTAQHAIAASLPQIQSYGGQGYTPGVFDAAGSGAGSHTISAVNGVIVSRRH
jgi:hypothetical protein